MEKPLFTGACTALVTPFHHSKINLPMVDTLLRRQLEAGIPAVVIAGTTGESATLSDEEKCILYRRAKDFVGDRCMIIAGSGSNDTAHAVALSREAEAAGADALLVVSPYYNKATPEGLFSHFMSIAHAVSIPIILYNVPSRTGVDIPVHVYKRLCMLPNVAGVKEASTDITKIARIKAACPSRFQVWAGNDDMVVPAMSLGSAGMISVLSNILPAETQAMTTAALRGDYETASALQLRYLPLIEKLFCEVNPIPVKEAMCLIGYDCGGCRLPLTSIDESKAQQLKATLNSLL